MQVHLILVGVPAALTLVLWVLIWSGKGAHPATYTLSEPWTHPPILWAATDEAIGDVHHGHDTAGLSVGGGASGTW